MPTTALYRKKRPKNFSDIVGQPHVVRTLLNQLSSGHISHAYLFCGTRGTGKTSAAKVFSRAVNCLSPRDGEPCNICDVCEGIIAERNLNVIEIDAASNNGVDNIRELREDVKYPPTEGRYRVYIIDEVHMLTGSAFNALLKTLEEPPPHVIFILATTDPQKIPATILSRCQRYDFKRITVADITQTLTDYLREEGIRAEAKALRYIASVSDGAMRDALSILDQCLSYYEDEMITLEKALDLLGAVDRRALFEFTEALARFDSGRALAFIDAASREGKDFAQFVNDIIKHLRDLLVVSHLNGENILEYGEETLARLKGQRSNLSDAWLIDCIRVFSELQNELRYSAHARMALEVCAIKLCVASAPASTAPVSVSAAPSAPAGIPASKLTVSEPAPAPAAPASATPSPNILKSIKSGWMEFTRGLTPPLKSMLANCAVETEGDSLKIICDNESTLRLLKDKQSAIREALSKKFKLTEAHNLAFAVSDGYNNVTQGGEIPPASNVQESPAPPFEDDPWAAFGDQISME